MPHLATLYYSYGSHKCEIDMHLPYYHSAKFKTPFARVFQELAVDSKGIRTIFPNHGVSRNRTVKAIFGLAFVVATPYYVESSNFVRCLKVFT